MEAPSAWPLCPSGLPPSVFQVPHHILPQQNTPGSACPFLSLALASVVPPSCLTQLFWLSIVNRAAPKWQIKNCKLHPAIFQDPWHLISSWLYVMPRPGSHLPHVCPASALHIPLQPITIYVQVGTFCWEFIIIIIIIIIILMFWGQEPILPLPAPCKQHLAALTGLWLPQVGAKSLRANCTLDTVRSLCHEKYPLPYSSSLSTIQWLSLLFFPAYWITQQIPPMEAAILYPKASAASQVIKQLPQEGLLASQQHVPRVEFTYCCLCR